MMTTPTTMNCQIESIFRDDQPGLQDGDNQRADDRAHDIPFAAEEISTTDDNSGYR